MTFPAAVLWTFHFSRVIASLAQAAGAVIWRSLDRHSRAGCSRAKEVAQTIVGGQGIGLGSWSWSHEFGEVVPWASINADLAGRVELRGIGAAPLDAAGSGGLPVGAACHAQGGCAGDVELILHPGPVGSDVIRIDEECGVCL